MTEEQKDTGPGLVKYETLPAELRAKMLESQQSLFLNVAKFEQGQRVAQMLSQSDFVPKRFQGKVGNCLIALDLAETLNCKPILLMQSMYVVHGEPAFKGSFVAAMLNASGRYDKLKYRFDGEGDEYGCTAYATDRKTKEVVEGPKITMAIVKGEGWLTNQKWKTMPEVMFTYRAAAWFGRRHDPDILMGMQTVEEAQDIIDITPNRNGVHTADDITEKLKANATKTRQPAEPMSQTEGFVNAVKGDSKSAVPGEQQPGNEPTTKKTEDLKNGNSSIEKTQGPPSSAWDPYKTEIQLKYGAKKAEIIKLECAKLEINIEGLLPREAHSLLLDSVKAEQEEEDQTAYEVKEPVTEIDNKGDQQSDDTGSGESGGEDQVRTPQEEAHKIMLDVKEARRKEMMHGDKPREDHEVIKTDTDDWSEDDPQKMDDTKAPDAIRADCIRILQHVADIDRGIWMKTKTQVGIMTTPRFENMPIEKLIEWATLAKSMTDIKV